MKSYKHNYGREIRVWIAIFSTLAGLSALVPVEQKATAISPYDSGYNHGCSDANGGNYLNSPGRGPSFHTSEFMNGYYAGLNSCGGGGGGGSNGGGGNVGQSHSSLVSKVCNFANTNPGLAAGAATLLGYPGLDVAVRALCAMR